MDPYERFAAHRAGKPVDRPLNFDIVMTFAARYIGQPLARYYLDHRVLCAANLAVMEAFELDVVQAISDPYREAADLGLDVAFPADGLPLRRAPLLEREVDLGRVVPIDPASGRRMADRLAAIRRFRESVGGVVPIMGWVEGALALATVLRGDTTLMLDLYDRPDWVRELLETCVEVEIAFARAQVEAGADIIGLGDAIASQVSRTVYAELALPYERRVFDAVHEMGAVARLHICGDISHILPLVGRSGADIVDVDWMVDMEAAAAALGPGCIPCGNFDPVAVMLEGTPDEVRRVTHRALDAGGPRTISAAGCEIPADTPSDNLRAQATALKERGALPRA